MERSDLDRMACAGAELPDRLGYADTLYFLMLRALYQFARATDMPPERGRREKGKIEEAVRRYRADEWSAMVRALQFRKTGEALSEYRKARNEAGPLASAPWARGPVAAMIAAADGIAEALDNIPIERGDAVVRQVQRGD